MNGNTHAIAGVATGLAWARFAGADVETTVIMAGAGAVAALVPDWIQINAPGLNRTIKGAFGHRGFSHWLLTVGALYWLLSQYAPLYSTPVALAYLSHLLLDSFNAPGIPAFWPFPWRLRIARFKSDGGFNNVLQFIAGLLAIWGVIGLLPTP